MRLVLSCCHPTLPLWIDESPMNLCEILGLQPKGVPPYRSRPDERADQVRNDVTTRCMVFTLAFDSSPIKGEGELVGLSCCHPTLWILP